MWNQVGGTLSNSMAQAMGRFASLLPGILAFLVAVVLFSLIGWLLAWVVRRILIALHFDERLGRGTEAVTEWSPRQTPAGLAARLVFWVFVVNKDVNLIHPTEEVVHITHNILVSTGHEHPDVIGLTGTQ